MLLVFGRKKKKKKGVFEWMYTLWTSIFLVNVHYAANVHGNAAGPLPVSLSSFLISSICISFSHRCHIWSSRRCMWSTRSTAVLGGRSRAERSRGKCFLPYCGVFLPTFATLVCFGVNQCLFSEDFSSLCTKTLSVSRVQKQQFVAFQQDDC